MAVHFICPALPSAHVYGVTLKSIQFNDMRTMIQSAPSIDDREIKAKLSKMNLTIEGEQDVVMSLVVDLAKSPLSHDEVFFSKLKLCLGIHLGCMKTNIVGIGSIVHLAMIFLLEKEHFKDKLEFLCFVLSRNPELAERCNELGETPLQFFCRINPIVDVNIIRIMIKFNHRCTLGCLEGCRILPLHYLMKNQSHNRASIADIVWSQPETMFAEIEETVRRLSLDGRGAAGAQVTVTRWCPFLRASDEKVRMCFEVAQLHLGLKKIRCQIK